MKGLGLLGMNRVYTMNKHLSYMGDDCVPKPCLIRHVAFTLFLEGM